MQKYVRGQVWWCKNSYDVSNGDRELDKSDKQKLFDHIQKGIRPVLIISNNVGNKFSETVQVIPCTSADKKTLPTHCSFYIEKVRNTFLCEQIRTINKTDLVTYLATLDEKEMEEVERCSQISLGIVQPTHREKIVLGINEESSENIIINKEDKNGAGTN